MSYFESAHFVHHFDSSKVAEKWFQIFVDFERVARHAQVNGSEATNVFKFILFDELDYNVLLGLDLQHFADQTKKGRRLHMSGSRTANVLRYYYYHY